MIPLASFRFAYLSLRGKFALMLGVLAQGMAALRATAAIREYAQLLQCQRDALGPPAPASVDRHELARSERLDRAPPKHRAQAAAVTHASRSGH